MDRLFKRSQKTWESVLGGISVCRTCEDGDWRLLNKELGCIFGRTKPAEYPRLALKGSHTNNYGDPAMGSQFRTCAVPAFKGARQQVYDNKPGSHWDYAYHEVLQPPFLLGTLVYKSPH